MGNAVPEAFAQALGTDTADPDISSQSLIKIMSEEVSKSVNSAITTSRDAESRFMSHVTPSRRLNDMVEYARSMMQSFIRKTTSFACLCRKSSPGDLEVVDVEDDDHDESCSSLPVQVGSSETDSKQSADSSESRKSQAQKIVSKELGDILDILLDDASDAERDVLLRDTYQESDSVVSDISESAGAAVRADNPKITLLLAKQYAKQLIHRAARNLKKIFSPNSKVKSRESLQSFADSVCELLQPEGGEKHPADEERQLEKLQHIAEGRDLVFTEALRSLLSEYTIDGMTPESFCQLGPFRNTQAIRRATCSTVWRFQGNCPKVSSINDRSDWKIVKKALTVIGFSEEEVEELLNIIASVLHLGNVQYGGEEGTVCITSDTQIKYLTRLLGVNGPVLTEALTHKKIIAKGEELVSPLNLEQASSARDALSKAVYGRTFTWLVNKINSSLAYTDDSYKNCSVIGLLDIYGFEVFQNNSFEQFCINYCNEKLQQLFIELTLKSEQEEYEAEGITWEPVQYFNNKIICDLVEEKFKGIISILDEECLRPGDASDLTFLEKLEDTVGGHPHFVTHKLGDAKTRKVMGRDEFRLLHYAGEVNYNVNGFLDKNNDLLFRNLKEVMCMSENKILTQCFDREELTDKKRPETAATQFKASLAKLMEILMSKEPSYVRCIKPNDSKQSGRFDEVLIRHQVKYLGLMENLRVRRAGFAYRRRYEVFLQRYKSLCPDTWPNWQGKLSDGVATLVKHLGYKPEEYKLGRSKIFIRFPKTLFATEDALETRKHSLATKLQAGWRGYSQKSKYQKLRTSAIAIQAWWRGILARRRAQRRRQAADTIRRFIKGFIYRHKERCPENEYFLDYVRYSFLMKLRRNLPKNVLDKSWPTPPAALVEASDHLRKLCMQNMVWSYCKKISPEWKHQMEQKMIASEIFKDKKDNYPQSVPKLFVSTRLNGEDINPKVVQALGTEKMKYAVPVTKYDRKGYKARPRQLLLTGNSAVIVEEGKLKQRIDYGALKGISVSSLSDGLFVLHVPSDDNKQKGDVVLQSDYVIETLTKIAICADKMNTININQGSIKFTVGQGKEGVIDFTPGSELLVAKAKNGHLSVTAPRLNSR
uniref:unconventional myosin-Ic-like n=1 Tax=Epinephelus lanceolatus TaxID=310571 RepID=UPI0014474102|nr:unconventional myosin-Ic-like [Epinephelus lanceolatus]